MTCFSSRGSVLARTLDRMFGIPLVFFLGLFYRRKKNSPEPPSRIGILISAALGDTIVFSPFIKAIKQKCPHAEIVLFTGPSNVSVTVLLSGFDRMVEINPHRVLESISKIRQAGVFDLWFDVGQWARLTALLSYFAKANYRIGFCSHRQYRHFVFDRAVSHSNQIHEWENFLKLTSGFTVSPEFPSIHLEVAHISKQIVIHPFAGGSQPQLKAWSTQKWVDLIDHLTLSGHSVLISGTKSDIPSAAQIQSACEKPDQVGNIAGTMGLEELARTLAACELVISVNTGVMHLSAALGTKTISLNGPTSSRRWGPLGSNTLSVNSALLCSPCLHLGFDYGCSRNLCMLEITVDRVLQAVQRLISIPVPETAKKREKENFQIEVVRPMPDIKEIVLNALLN